jgi:hypothetical protein
MEQKLWLSRDCAVCVAADALVCLDTRTDEYILLDAREANLAAQVVHGWPMVVAENDGALPRASESRSVEDATDLSDLTQELLRRRILVRDAAAGKHATPIAVTRPSATLLEEYEPYDISLTFNDIFSFWRSALWAAKLTRAGNTQAIVHRLSNRKKVANRAHPREATPDVTAQMRCTLATFLRLRPLLWTSHNQRRLELYTLLHLLESRNLPARCVWGIWPRPLTTHVWLQYEDVVIDDSPEVASSFTPLLTT